ncbi:MAG: hypothetical protein PSX36_12070 [bacterium]|nr:hypothetical protein [bacterium]
MKTTKLKIGALLLAIAVALTPVLLTNCAKGDTGPAGTNGTNGTNGNANVKSGTFQNMTWTFNNATLRWESVVSYSAITQEVVTSGAVLVYIDINGYYVQLPYSYVLGTGVNAVIVWWEAEHFVGGVRLKLHNSDLDNLVVPQSTAKFKIVAMTASARAAHPDVDTKNYQEVKTSYGISE